jgi:hypothetical protein
VTSIRIPYFDNAEVSRCDDDEVAPGDTAAAEAVLASFLALTPTDRIADSRHVFAYYRDYREAVGGKDWLDAEMGVPQTAADIWHSVTPGPVTVGKHDGHWYGSRMPVGARTRTDDGLAGRHDTVESRWVRRAYDQRGGLCQRQSERRRVCREQREIHHPADRSELNYPVGRQ